MKKEFAFAILCNLILYVIQFLLIPTLNFRLVTATNEGTAILCLSAAVVTVIGVIYVTDKIRCWLVALLVYGISIFLYSPAYAYGIGVTGLNLDGASARFEPDFRYFMILIICGLVLLIQVGICLIAKFIRHVSTSARSKRMR